MSLFFTSDPHYWHANIIRFCDRPFASMEQMVEALIVNHNRVVKPSDDVWFLGDLFFCREDVAHRLLDRLNGRLHLVMGNHDKVIARSPSLQQRFASVHEHRAYLNISIRGEALNLVLDHYPMHSWNKAYHGAYNLHGHVHSKVACDGVHRRYDVGVDANDYTPVSIEHIHRTLSAIKAREPDDTRRERRER
jgi:calcineurin-like phosphoesterase family protein